MFNQMFLGLRTAIYKVSDLEQAKSWYSDVLNIEPYFDEPFYVGFNVGGFELGLDPDAEDVTLGNNLQVYWGVENAQETFDALLEKGAKMHSGPQNVGGEIIVASVFDPFGNIFGVIENPAFKLENTE
jgi:predicted enzyme related to lactoylglutathione lyase